MSIIFARAPQLFHNQRRTGEAPWNSRRFMGSVNARSALLLVHHCCQIERKHVTQPRQQTINSTRLQIYSMTSWWNCKSLIFGVISSRLNKSVIRVIVCVSIWKMHSSNWIRALTNESSSHKANKNTENENSDACIYQTQSMCSAFQKRDEHTSVEDIQNALLKSSEV
jgi:hypothetical protein